MKNKRMVCLIGAILILLFISFIIYSQIEGEGEEGITQADFVNILMTVMGLEEQLPEAATLAYKTTILTNRGYMPPEGWKPDETLLVGQAAVVIALILEIPLNLAVTPEEIMNQSIQELADRGIIIPFRGSDTLPGFDEVIPLDELIDMINRAAEMPGVRINPYRVPVSPVM